MLSEQPAILLALSLGYNTGIADGAFGALFLRGILRIGHIA
jgi:hypothetical protein